MNTNGKQHFKLFEWFYFNIGTPELPYKVDKPIKKQTILMMKIMWEEVFA